MRRLLLLLLALVLLLLFSRLLLFVLSLLLLLLVLSLLLLPPLVGYERQESLQDIADFYLNVEIEIRDILRALLSFVDRGCQVERCGDLPSSGSSPPSARVEQPNLQLRTSRFELGVVGCGLMHACRARARRLLLQVSVKGGKGSC